METVKVLSATAMPVGSTPVSNLQETINATTQTMNETLKQFSDESPAESKEAKAKSILNEFQDFIKSDRFVADIKETAKKYNIPEKKLAQNFFEKVLGTVGDVLGIAISVVCQAGHMIINIVGTIAHSIINLIGTIANGLVSMVTLNRTCVAH